KAAENKAAENKAAENKAAENKAAENKAAENKAAENKAAENKAAENKAAENKAAENKAAENQKDRLNASYYNGISALPKDPVVAMAYVPFQLDTTSYDTEEAFRNGTLFKVLNKPFLGYLKPEK
ncbi:MAG: spore coat associated protein CotJA, partial [Oscillospiraceae bacterium]|nr:spore coat associated protein CotJA [Oscillospiraceae bacterium]